MTERLDKPVTSVTDMFATISLSEPLFSHSQKQQLNPLVVHVHSATRMPSAPVPFAELKNRFIVLKGFIHCNFCPAHERISEAEYCFQLCLSVCLFVCLSTQQLKNY